MVPAIGVLITLFVCEAWALGSQRLFRKLLEPFDPAARVGFAGLIGLGIAGTLSFFFLLIPGALILGPWLLVIASIGYSLIWKSKPNFFIPDQKDWPFVLPLVVCGVIALVGVLSPADTMEWDSLAYHLAVPKIWLQDGHASYIPFIHHSNFPFVFDSLYTVGLTWGGDGGAKAFVLFAAISGAVAIFGIARQLYGKKAAWWATLAFATIPVVLWLSGTAYIDVPNGLFAGLGIALAAMYCQKQERDYLWLAGMFLGFAAGSKYTGLQTIFVVALFLFIVGIRRKEVGSALSASLLVGVIALLIASPWYAKNVILTGNPVYPFFYSILGGKNWSAEQAKQYSHEQQTFGNGIDANTGKRDYSQIGNAVLGLAYQPGRYINPAQTFGGGNPMGAIGVVILCSMLAWAFSGRARAFELFSLGAVGLSLLLWFYLSQQSRYIVTLAVPLSIMLGGGVVRLRAGPILAGATVLQAIYSVGLIYFFRTSNQTPVVLGFESRETYLSRNVSFYDASQAINKQVPKTGRVILYDEVFGYLLDVPYYWGNPGHSNEIAYSQLNSGREFVEVLKQKGITHVYINLSPGVKAPELSQAWIAAMGLSGPPQPLSPDIFQKYGLSGFEQKYVPLIADAVASRELTVTQVFENARRTAVKGILFQVAVSSPGG